MKKKSQSKAALTRRTFSAGLGAAGIVAGTAPFNIVRAQGAALKVGVLLPRSGRAGRHRARLPARCRYCAGILKDLGLPTLQIMNADTETNVDVARSRAEKLISEGAQLLVGAFDSGQTTAIAQVAEQKGIPLVINIAAAPPITEQGYKFVFRNFPTGADDPAGRLRQSKGNFPDHRLGAEVGGLPACQRHLRHVDAEGHGRHVPEVRHALQDSPGNRLRPRLRAIFRSRSRRPRRPAPRRCSRSAVSTTRSCSRASWSSSAGRRWRC